MKKPLFTLYIYEVPSQLSSWSAEAHGKLLHTVHDIDEAERLEKQEKERIIQDCGDEMLYANIYIVDQEGQVI